MTLPNKTTFIGFATLFVLSLFLAPLAVAAGPSGVSGKSNIAHLYLFEKNPSGWTIVTEGAWGKMLYNQTGATFNFNFNGHRLNQDTSYTLTYYSDPPPESWPPDAVICFGSGTADSYGDVHIQGSATIPSLPIATDYNYPTGAKIWLVLSSDVNCTAGTWGAGWQGAEYLFEYQLMTFTVAP